MSRLSPGFRRPNVCVTKAEAEWLREAARILRNPEKPVHPDVRRKAAVYVTSVARAAELAAREGGS